ncbi:MAG: hypothetical protein NPIRA04_03500 [Nitrospirales bacterium]|nr:MAG: hypothetical protein NPIRA04_03500 [Nitrospirales bacterium]
MHAQTLADAIFTVILLTLVAIPVIPSFGMLRRSENMERLNRVLQDRHPKATWLTNMRGVAQII